MAFCCLCERNVDAWLPHPQRAQRSEFMRLLDTVGSDLSLYGCPHCGCNDRDRHLWMYMAAAGLPEQLNGARILHLAPEIAIEPRLLACQPAEYVRGDLMPSRAGIQRLDVQSLPFADGHFDLVIANHLLEHVDSPAIAIGELARCLVPGGILIAQTPYAPKLVRTFELHGAQSKDFATLFYGQSDHRRLFGSDIADYFNAAGLNGSLLSHGQLLADMDAPQFGCNGREPFFLFSKPAQALAQAA